MKRIIRLTESDLTRIVKRVIKEQESLTTFPGGTSMDKEIEALEELKKQLENTKKDLELDKKNVGGATIDRIRKYFTIRKLRKENKELEDQLKELERDIKDLESGKVLTTTQKKHITYTIGSIIGYIGAIIAEMKTNILGKTVKNIKGSI